MPSAFFFLPLNSMIFLLSCLNNTWLPQATSLSECHLPPCTTGHMPALKTTHVQFYKLKLYLTWYNSNCRDDFLLTKTNVLSNIYLFESKVKHYPCRIKFILLFIKCMCAHWAGLLFLPFSRDLPPQMDWGSAVSGSPRHQVSSPLNTMLSHTGKQCGVRGLPGGAVWCPHWCPQQEESPAACPCQQGARAQAKGERCTLWGAEGQASRVWRAGECPQPWVASEEQACPFIHHSLLSLHHWYSLSDFSRPEIALGTKIINKSESLLSWGLYSTRRNKQKAR